MSLLRRTIVRPSWSTILGGSAIVIGSFWLTLAIMTLFDSTFDDDTDRPGPNVKTILLEKKVSARACMTQCQGEKTCLTWVYGKDSGACYLKSTTAKPVPAKGLVAGEVRR